MSGKIIQAVLWTLVYLVCAYFFITFTAPYFGWWHEQLEQRRISEIGWLIGHFTFGFFALFLAPLQFIPVIRKMYPRIHHTIGKIYIIGALVSASFVFYLLTHYPLPGSVPSLALLNCLWIFTTIAAYRLALDRNHEAHRQFMVRSYVCALAFVYLRLFDQVNHLTGILNFIQDEEARETVIDWLWVYPILITEFFLQWRPTLKKRGRRFIT